MRVEVFRRVEYSNLRYQNSSEWRVFYALTMGASRIDRVLPHKCMMASQSHAHSHLGASDRRLSCCQVPLSRNCIGECSTFLASPMRLFHLLPLFPSLTTPALSSSTLQKILGDLSDHSELTGPFSSDTTEDIHHFADNGIHGGQKAVQK